MERTIPYFKDVIVPVSLNEGKSVLIASSENAIRGLLMHLCDIPIGAYAGGYSLAPPAAASSCHSHLSPLTISPAH